MSPYSDIEDEEPDLDDEEDISEGYDEGKLRLQKQRPQNSDGSFYCPFCSLKKADFNLPALLHHADVASVSKGFKVKATKLGEHKALSEWLKELQLQKRQTMQQPVQTLVGLREESAKRRNDVMLWPPAGIILNVGIRQDCTEESVRASLLQYYKDFHPLDAKLYFGRWATVGWAVLTFEPSLEGLTNAKAFTTSMTSSGCGKKAWRCKTQQGTLDNVHYGWQALEEDLEDPGLWLSHDGLQDLKDLRRYSRATECEVLKWEREKRVADERKLQSQADSFRELKDTWHHQDLELANKQARYEEDMAKQQENHNQQMDIIQVLHLRREAMWKERERTAEEQINMRLLELGRMAEQLAQKSEETEAIRSDKERVEMEIVKLKTISEQKKEALLKLEALNQQHNKEKLQLEERYQKLKRTQMKKHDKEREVHEVEQEMQQLKVTCSPHSVDHYKASAKLEELQEELKELRADLKDSEANVTVLTVEERRRTDEATEAMEAALTVFDTNREKPSRTSMVIEKLSSKFPDLPMREIQPKRVGELDQDVWYSAIMEQLWGGKGKKGKCAVEDRDNKFFILFSDWEKRIMKPELHIWKNVPVPKEGVPPENWDRKMIVDEECEALQELRALYPPAVAADVVEASRLLDEHNPSGRYPRTMLWNHTKGKLATMAEVVERLGVLLVALDDLRMGVGLGKRRKNGTGRGVRVL